MDQDRIEAILRQHFERRCKRGRLICALSAVCVALAAALGLHIAAH